MSKEKLRWKKREKIKHFPDTSCPFTSRYFVKGNIAARKDFLPISQRYKEQQKKKYQVQRKLNANDTKGRRIMNTHEPADVKSG